MTAIQDHDCIDVCAVDSLAGQVLKGLQILPVKRFASAAPHGKAAPHGFDIPKFKRGIRFR